MSIVFYEFTLNISKIITLCRFASLKLYQNTVTVVDFMLDDLSCPAFKSFCSYFKIKCLILHAYFLIPFYFTRATEPRERQLSFVSYGSDLLIISGFSIIIYFPSLSKHIMLLFTPIIFAAIPTHTSLCAVKVSSKSWAVC